MKQQKKIDRRELTYEANEYTFNFKQFEKIRSLGDKIFSDKLHQEKLIKNSNLLENVLELCSRARTRANEKNK